MASSSVRLAHIVAHQGGWDEILLVAGPIVVIVALLAIVKRRVGSIAAETAEVTDATTGIAEVGGTDEIASHRDEARHLRDGG